MNYNILKHSDFINHSFKFLVLLVIQNQKKQYPTHEQPELNSLQLWQFEDPGGIYCCVSDTYNFSVHRNTCITYVLKFMIRIKMHMINLSLRVP